MRRKCANDPGHQQPETGAPSEPAPETAKIGKRAVAEVLGAEHYEWEVGDVVNRNSRTIENATGMPKAPDFRPWRTYCGRHLDSVGESPTDATGELIHGRWIQSPFWTAPTMKGQTQTVASKSLYFEPWLRFPGIEYSTEERTMKPHGLVPARLGGDWTASWWHAPQRTGIDAAKRDVE